MTTTSTDRSLRNEREFIPASLEDLAELRARLIDAGQTERVADGIVSWVLNKAVGNADRTGAPTRARYRKVLADLVGRPHNGRGSEPRPAEGDITRIVGDRTDQLIRDVLARHRARSQKAARTRRANTLRRG